MMNTSIFYDLAKKILRWIAATVWMAVWMVAPLAWSDEHGNVTRCSLNNAPINDDLTGVFRAVGAPTSVLRYNNGRMCTEIMGDFMNPKVYIRRIARAKKSCPSDCKPRGSATGEETCVWETTKENQWCWLHSRSISLRPGECDTIKGARICARMSGPGRFGNRTILCEFDAESRGLDYTKILERVCPDNKNNLCFQFSGKNVIANKTELCDLSKVTGEDYLWGCEKWMNRPNRSGCSNYGGRSWNLPLPRPQLCAYLDPKDGDKTDWDSRWMPEHASTPWSNVSKEYQTKALGRGIKQGPVNLGVGQTVGCVDTELGPNPPQFTVTLPKRGPNSIVSAVPICSLDDGEEADDAQSCVRLPDKEDALVSSFEAPSMAVFSSPGWTACTLNGQKECFVFVTKASSALLISAAPRHVWPVCAPASSNASSATYQSDVSLFAAPTETEACVGLVGGPSEGNAIVRYEKNGTGWNVYKAYPPDLWRLATIPLWSNRLDLGTIGGRVWSATYSNYDEVALCRNHQQKMICSSRFKRPPLSAARLSLQSLNFDEWKSRLCQIVLVGNTQEEQCNTTVFPASITIAPDGRDTVLPAASTGQTFYVQGDLNAGPKDDLGSRHVFWTIRSGINTLNDDLFLYATNATGLYPDSAMMNGQSRLVLQDGFIYDANPSQGPTVRSGATHACLGGWDGEMPYESKKVWQSDYLRLYKDSDGATPTTSLWFGRFCWPIRYLNYSAKGDDMIMYAQTDPSFFRWTYLRDEANPQRGVYEFNGKRPEPTFPPSALELADQTFSVNDTPEKNPFFRDAVGFPPGWRVRKAKGEAVALEALGNLWMHDDLRYTTPMFPGQIMNFDANGPASELQVANCKKPTDVCGSFTLSPHRASTVGTANNPADPIRIDSVLAVRMKDSLTNQFTENKFYAWISGDALKEYLQSQTVESRQGMAIPLIASDTPNGSTPTPESPASETPTTRMPGDPLPTDIAQGNLPLADLRFQGRNISVLNDACLAVIDGTYSDTDRRVTVSWPSTKGAIVWCLKGAME